MRGRTGCEGGGECIPASGSVPRRYGNGGQRAGTQIQINAPAHTVTENRRILRTILPSDEHSGEEEEPARGTYHWSEPAKRISPCLRNSEVSSSFGGSSFLINGRALIAAAAPASIASSMRSKSSHARDCTSGRRTKSAGRPQPSSRCCWPAP